MLKHYMYATHKNTGIYKMLRELKLRARAKLVLGLPKKKKMEKRKIRRFDTVFGVSPRV